MLALDCAADSFRSPEAAMSVSSSPIRRCALLLLLALGLVAPGLLAQDQAVTLHNAILRSGPSKTSQRLGIVTGGEVVTLLPHGHKTGYYRVSTQNEAIGWVTETALRLLDPSEVHQPADSNATPPVAPPAGLIVTAGDFDTCPLQGNPSPKGSRFHEIEALNRLKNRSAFPAAADIDPSVTLEKLVGDGTDDTGSFDTGKAAEITGFVLHVKPGGKSETTNCRKGDPDHRDAHIELTVSATDTLEIRRVIIEVTPRWRAAMKAAGIDWATTTLQHTIEHKWVTVRGWLFRDDEHKQQAENTRPGGDTNWRATIWEVHPVTSLAVVPHP
jgi:hypothetical protein